MNAKNKQNVQIMGYYLLLIQKYYFLLEVRILSSKLSVIRENDVVVQS